MGSPTIDLVGVGGWEHGFIAVRPPATNRPGAKIGKARRPLITRPSGRSIHRPGQMRAKPPQLIGPSMGELGKAARGSKSLPTGKSALTSGGRAAAFQAGHALPPPSKGSPHGYPVTDAKSWENARRAVGRVKSPARRAALAGLLRRTAGQYGKTKALKASWAASNTGPALEFAAWEHELRGRGGKWATTGGASGQADRKPAQQMTVAELRDHLANFHSGAPNPPGIRGGGGHITRARLKAQLVAQHELMHQMLAGQGPRGHLADPGVAHSHGQAATYSNTGPALEFTVPDAPTFPVTGPIDLLISRDPEDGSAVVRHRRGGGEIGRIRHSDDGQWRAARDGKDLSPHTRQRGALLELIGVHNTAAPSPYRRQPAQAAEPLQPRPQQTDLMRAYGIPAVTLAAATPVHGASDGPKITTGLGQRGQTIYKKLRGRGFPHERAHSFARRAERKATG